MSIYFFASLPPPAELLVDPTLGACEVLEKSCRWGV